MTLKLGKPLRYSIKWCNASQCNGPANAQKRANIKIYKEPSYKEQNENQKSYESSLTNLQVNDYVYLSSNEDVFAKSYDVKV